MRNLVVTLFLGGALTLSTIVTIVMVREGFNPARNSVTSLLLPMVISAVGIGGCCLSLYFLSNVGRPAKWHVPPKLIYLDRWNLAVAILFWAMSMMIAERAATESFLLGLIAWGGLIYWIKGYPLFTGPDERAYRKEAAERKRRSRNTKIEKAIRKPDIKREIPLVERHLPGESHSTKNRNGLGRFGVGLLIAGGIVFLIGFNLDTSVSSGYGRVHNIGLMNDRQNLILFAGVLAVVGAVFVGFGSKNARAAEAQGSTRSCPFCAETIKSEAKICRFCKKDLPTVSMSKLTPEHQQTWTPQLEALSKAIVDNDIMSVKEIISEGIDPNTRNEYGITPIQMAHKCGRKDIVELLNNISSKQ